MRRIIALLCCFALFRSSDACTWQPFLDQTLSGDNREIYFQVTLEQCKALCCTTERPWCLAVEWRDDLNFQCNLLENSHMDGTSGETLSSNTQFSYYLKTPEGQINAHPQCTGDAEWATVAQTAILDKNAEVITGVTLDACKEACCEPQRAWCKSLEFRSTDGTCHLAVHKYGEVETHYNAQWDYWGPPLPSPPPPQAPNTGYFQPQQQQMGWHAARDYCENLGGILAVPHSQDDMDAIAGSRVHQNSWWIGVHDLDGDEVFMGLDGSTTWSTYHNWYRSGNNQQPTLSDGNQKCVVVRYQSGHKWVSNSCGTNRYFVCQWVAPPHPPAPPPNPPSPPAPPQPPPRPPGTELEALCQEGIIRFDHSYGPNAICCPSSCGTCGGAGCSTRDGSGGTVMQDCCCGTIYNDATECASSTDTGCRLALKPPPPSPPALPPPPAFPPWDTCSASDVSTFGSATRTQCLTWRNQVYPDAAFIVSAMTTETNGLCSYTLSNGAQRVDYLHISFSMICDDSATYTCLCYKASPPPPPALPCADDETGFWGDVTCESLTADASTDTSYTYGTIASPTSPPPPPMYPGVNPGCSCDSSTIIGSACRGTCSTFCLSRTPNLAHAYSPWPGIDY